MNRIRSLRRLPLPGFVGPTGSGHSPTVRLMRQSLFTSFSQRAESSSASAAASSEPSSTDLVGGRQAVEISVERKARIRNISKCLELYLDSLRAHEKMIKRETAAFELGKRHLANIMGWPADVPITQDDIDRAIRYLFPTGLTDPSTQPVMKPPEEIMPKFKKMDFDANGRPADALFYTQTPKFYNLLSVVHKETLILVREYDRLLLSGALAKMLADSGGEEADRKLILAGSSWMSKDTMGTRLFDNEAVSGEMYASLLLALEYLAEHPLAHKCADFIMSFRESMNSEVQSSGESHRKIFGSQVPTVQLDVKSGRHFAVGRGRVKRVVAEVCVRERGTGDYTINGHHYSEFRPIFAREILLCPLIVTDLLGKVDISATIVEHANRGPILIPRAVRHGASLALAALFPEHRETLRLAGLLTYDPRKKERIKINRKGARAKWIWKKR